MDCRPTLQRRRGRGAETFATFAMLGALVFGPVAAHADPANGSDPVDAPAGRAAAPKVTIMNAAPPKPARDGTLLGQVRERAAEMVLTALNFVGVQYTRGGNSQQTGFDCSGFTRFVFDSSLGLMLPRRADEQAAAPGLIEVQRADLQPGDLVFFNTLQRTFSHVGIYIGDNRFVHAPRPGSEVRIEDMGYAYWKSRFTGARRAVAVATLAPVGDPSTARVSAR